MPAPQLPSPWSLWPHRPPLPTPSTTTPTRRRTARRTGRSRRRPRATRCSSSRPSPVTERARSPATSPSATPCRIWQRASDQGALTETGKTFGRDVKRFQEAEKSIGYGKLSGVGQEEWQGIGKRHAEDYADFFAALDRRDEKIASVTTSVTRTQQSAEAMHQGLAEGGLNLDSELAPLTENDNLLRFGNSASPPARR